MNERDTLRIVPPSPELYDKIMKTKQRLKTGEALPEKESVDLLDLCTFTLITNRPNKTRAHTLISPTKDFVPITGTKRTLALLVDFSNLAASHNQEHYNELLFSQGTLSTGSMRDFYREVSYSKVDLRGEVSGTGGPTSGWYRAPNPKTYYTDNQYGFGSYPKNVQKLVEEMVDLAAPHVNFADYDNDGDGTVDALIIIAAGSGAEITGNVNDIWSHKWGINPRAVDGVKVSTYFMAPEDGRIGVMSHELGHLLMKWPDLYDTDYSSAGTGYWDLMAAGSWNSGGNRPAHPTCYLKYKAGWITPKVISGAEQEVTIKPYANNAQAYKLPVSSKEYFLITNRQKAGFDDHLPGEGMIIEHVDENQSNNTDENHYLVDIEQSDGKFDLNKYANKGDATDAFPCSQNSSFTKDTTPNSNAYDGTDKKISITNIQHSGENITAKINVGGDEARAWHYNKKAKMTFASHHSQNVWVYIDSIGWRRIKTDSADGVSNMFCAFCKAVANDQKVHVNVDGKFVYIMYLV